MLHIVEIRLGAGSLAAEMTSMRTWLDHMRFQPVGFRQLSAAGVYRVDFRDRDEARAFARAFGGLMLDAQAAA